MNSTEHSQVAPLPAEPPRRPRWPKIIGFISAGIVFLALATILIPCLLRSALAANEASAVGSLRTIATAQKNFSEQHPEKGFALTLTDLGPSGGNEIDAALASGTKSGYVFTLTPGSLDSFGRITKYAATASPRDFDTTGTRNFFVDESGVIRGTHKNRPATASDPALQ